MIPQSNRTLSVKRLSDLALGGDTEAAFALACRYDSPRRGRKNEIEEHKWLVTAAKGGHPAARFNLAIIYLEGNKSIRPNHRLAVKYLEWLVKHGNTDASCLLAGCYMDGDGVKKNKAKAMQLFRTAAKAGDVDAQYNLGVAFSEGWNKRVDKRAALRWYDRAAKSGCRMAQFNLALAYDYGKGVRINQAKAVYWYQKAAAQGDAKAQCNLGVAYLEGTGVAPNRRLARKWLERAAENGDTKALPIVARMSADGRKLKRSSTPNERRK